VELEAGLHQKRKKRIRCCWRRRRRRTIHQEWETQVLKLQHLRWKTRIDRVRVPDLCVEKVRKKKYMICVRKEVKTRTREKEKEKGRGEKKNLRRRDRRDGERNKIN
jgi:hypothetical protein